MYLITCYYAFIIIQSVRYRVGVGAGGWVVWSAGLAAGVSTGRPAALLLPGTVSVVTAELCAHEGPPGGAAAARLHCRRQQR